MKNSRVQILVKDQTITSLPRVFVPLSVWQKIQYFVGHCQYEINGLGTVQRSGNDFTVEDVFLLKQHTGPGMNVVTDPKALNKFIYDLVSAGGDASKLKFQWHSHVDMLPFFSLEDMATIAGYMNDYMISLVVNKQGDFRCRLDLFKPFKLSLGVPLFIKTPYLNRELAEYREKEMRENVIVKRSLLDSFIQKRQASSEDPQEMLVEPENIVEEVEMD